MAEQFFQVRHQVDLALNLIDSASGNKLAVGQVKFFLADKPVAAIRKSGGTFVLINTGRENCRLRVEAFGFMAKVLDLDYGQLAENLPRLTLHLTPGQHYAGSTPCYTLEGQDPAITALEAVFRKGSGVWYRSFNAKKKTLTVFNPHRIAFDHEYYGLVNGRNNTYEPFRVLERVGEGDTEFGIDHPLAEEFQAEDVIGRVFFGTVHSDGRYVIKMRKDNTDGKYILRYVKHQEVFFKLIDFYQPETLVL